MADLLFVTGGARSGKSSFAERLASRTGAPVVYIATMEALDDEVRARIARHRTSRPEVWTTVESPLEIVEAVRDAPSDACVLLDCLSLWVSNRLLQLGEAFNQDDLDTLEIALERDIESLHALAAARSAPLILVTNEVGSSLVPEHALGRAYRDLLGRVNQRASTLATHAWLLVSGRALLLPPPDSD
ncbi:MAG: bifunctional adenosylcobinamide kinase/adenosylcobinamide-phosphate guanylyltransferase [Chloroflexi bacterium]|nr:MAG: bifunctional adenosylcobinamide kinase/adenosylcobinamide-phosphate guanylyltransferase [Chloroflexota bacterium]